MKPISRKDTLRLAQDPLSFALLMKKEEIEETIVAFVSVLMRNKTNPRCSK